MRRFHPSGSASSILVLCAVIVSSCTASRSDDREATSRTPTTTVSASSGDAAPALAGCALLTTQEVSAATGREYRVATPSAEPDRTPACLYATDASASHAIIVSVSRGDADESMAGAGIGGSMMGQNSTTTLAGLGDGATLVGATLMVRKGKDLAKVTLESPRDTALGRRLVRTLLPKL